MSNWALDILDMSWVEHTTEEVDFVIEALQLQGLQWPAWVGQKIEEIKRNFYHVLHLISPKPQNLL